MVSLLFYGVSYIWIGVFTMKRWFKWVRVSQIGDDRVVVCSYCLPASKTKPEARREGEESIHVADKGYLEGERS